MQNYRVTLTHPDLEGPLVMDMKATSAERAATRARGTAMHMYRHAELLAAAAVVEEITEAEFEASL